MKTNEELTTMVAQECGYGKPWQVEAPYPNFAESLDACVEFEATLTDRQLYCRFLYLVVLDDPTNIDNEICFASARQRCIAFLKVKGKL